MGGQVLLDEATFDAVKDAMWRLGAVGPGGMDWDELLASKSAQHSHGMRPSSSSGSGGAADLEDHCLSRLMSGTSFRCVCVLAGVRLRVRCAHVCVSGRCVRHSRATVCRCELCPGVP
jgi:hypothetical protein